MTLSRGLAACVLRGASPRPARRAAHASPARGAVGARPAGCRTPSSRRHAGCRGVRTLTAEIAVRGQGGAARLRGRVLPGSSAAAPLRLEAPAPFGAPIFILVGAGQPGHAVAAARPPGAARRARRATCSRPSRASRRSSDDLLALVCRLPLRRTSRRPGRAQRRPGGWMAVDARRTASGRSSRATAPRGGSPPGTAAPAPARRPGPCPTPPSPRGFPAPITIGQEPASTARPRRGADAAGVAAARPTYPSTPARVRRRRSRRCAALTLDELRAVGPAGRPRRARAVT